MARTRTKTEHQEQTLLVARVRQFLPDVLIYAVPNGGRRGKREAVRLKAEGVLAGIPDLVVAEPRGGFHGLYVEMKRVSGGRISPDQKRQIERLRERGYFVLVADDGSERAFQLVRAYLALPSGARALLD